MIGKWLSFVTFTLCSATAAVCEPQVFDTGNMLHEFCSDPSRRPICTSTVIGHYDMMHALGYRCSDQGVTKGQIADVVAKFLRDNPQKRNAAAAEITAAAVIQAFNCQRKTNGQ